MRSFGNSKKVVVAGVTGVRHGGPTGLVSPAGVLNEMGSPQSLRFPPGRVALATGCAEALLR